MRRPLLPILICLAAVAVLGGERLGVVDSAPVDTDVHVVESAAGDERVLETVRTTPTAPVADVAAPPAEPVAAVAAPPVEPVAAAVARGAATPPVTAPPVAQKAPAVAAPASSPPAIGAVARAEPAVAGSPDQLAFTGVDGSVLLLGAALVLAAAGFVVRSMGDDLAVQHRFRPVHRAPIDQGAARHRPGVHPTRRWTLALGAAHRPGRAVLRRGRDALRRGSIRRESAAGRPPGPDGV